MAVSVLPTAGDDGGTGSTPAPEASDASPVRIRRYEPRDREQVVAIFSTGMLGLIPALCWHVLTAGGVAASAAAATAALMGAVGARAHAPWPVLGLAVAGGAVSVPIAAWLFARNAMRDYVRGSLQTDLRDISTFYSDTGAGPGSAFWVAERVDDGQIVGHVALERKSAEEAELRRMSVRPGCRKLGIGAKLLAQLTAHAAAQGFRRVVLTTSMVQHAALALYKKNGWLETKEPFLYSGIISIHSLAFELGAPGPGPAAAPGGGM